MGENPNYFVTNYELKANNPVGAHGQKKNWCMAYPIGLLDYPQAFDSTRSDYPIAQWSNKLLGWPVKCGYLMTFQLVG